MQIPEDVARAMDAERFLLAAVQLRAACAAVDAAETLLSDLPSGRFAEFVGEQDFRTRLVDQTSALAVLADALAEVARRAP